MANELAELKAKYEKRLKNLRPHRVDPEATIVLKQILDVEDFLRRLAGLRKELYNYYDDDFFNAPMTQRAIAQARREIFDIKQEVAKLGFEQYIPPDKIDWE